MICSNCGNRMPDKSPICSICGSRQVKQQKASDGWTMQLVSCTVVPRRNSYGDMMYIESSRSTFVGIENDELVIYKQGEPIDASKSLFGMVLDRVLESKRLTNAFSWKEIKRMDYRGKKLSNDALVIVFEDENILELHLDAGGAEKIRNWFESRKSSKIHKDK